MNYVFCAGYKMLLFALYLKNVLDKEIVIVTYSTDVVEFCRAEKIDYIQIYQFRPHISSILKLIAFKKILDEVIIKIDMHKEDTFFVTSKTISYELFYLVKELSKKGNLYFVPTMRELKIFKSPYYKPFIRGIIYKLIIKIILGLDVMYYESNKEPRMGIDNNFMKKYNIKEFTLDLPFEELIFEAVKKNKMRYKSYDNLFIDSGIVDEIIVADSEKKLYKNLFELSIEFAFKKCPKSHKYTEEREMADSAYYARFNNCEELPRYLPVELFYNNIRKNVVSAFSTALITASKFDHLKAISLLELVDWYHESYKKEFKDHLIEESKNKIIFPKSFKELKEILLNDIVLN